MKTLSNYVFLILCFLLTSGTTVNAQETNIMIRAKAKDAKFIGSSIGGAHIIVKNASNGTILAEGMTSGSTGNTDKIMKEPHKRRALLSDNNTAGFLAKLDINKPTFLTVEAYAPKNDKQAGVLSSTQFWAIPGKDITGDGIILEIPGFIVDIISPQRHEAISGEQKIEIMANIVMMCGCPINKGGLWDSDDYEIKAIVSKEDEKTQEINLVATNKSSTFSAEVTLKSGLYEVVVYAYDPVTGNTGLDRTNIIVQ